MTTKQIQTVQDMIRAEYGVDCTVFTNREQTQVTTADRVIAKQNPKRLGLVVVNLSANIVYIRPIAAASATEAIQLNASGGMVSMNVHDDFVLPTMEWHGLGAAVNLAILVIEVCII